MIAKKILFLLIIFFFAVRVCPAQDIHFSQFYNSPLTINPANTGNFSGDWRIMNHFRKQWMALPVPFQTIAVGFDKVFYNNNDVIGAGIYVVNDKTGSVSLTVNKIYLSAAYKKYLRKYYVSGGIQIGYVNKTIDFNSLSFPSQYDHSIGAFNLQLNNNEAGSYDQDSYLDVNTGFLGITTFKEIKIEAGLAFYHINFPKESFTGGESRLPMRTVFHSSAIKNLSETWFIKPQILYMFHRKANDLMIGSDAGINLPSNPYHITKVFAGGYLRDGISRNAESVILTMGGSWNRFTLGLSYDFGFRNIKTAAGKRGSFEISLIYSSLNTIPNRITIPCNQY